MGLRPVNISLFEGLSGKLRKVAKFTLIMFALSLAGLSNQFQHIPAQPFGVFVGGVDEQTYEFLSIGIMIGPAISAVYVGVLILLLQFHFFQRLLSPLKSYGRMALTNYIFQTVFIYLAGYIFNLFGALSYLQSFIVCLLVFVIQLIFSVVWLRYFQFGPLEWVWRGLTYLDVPPMRKRIKKEA